MECCNLSYSGKPDLYFSVSQLNFMSDVSICCRKSNKFTERDTLKIFIAYGDSLLLSGKPLHSFCGAFSWGWERLYKRHEDYFPTGWISTLFAAGFRRIFPQRLIESCDWDNHFCSFSPSFHCRIKHLEGQSFPPPLFWVLPNGRLCTRGQPLSTVCLLSYVFF